VAQIMTKPQAFDKSRNVGWRAILLCVAVMLMTFPARGQQPQTAPQPPSQPAPQSNPPAPTPPGAQKSPEAQSEAQTETHITPQEAEELFRSVDEILNFASKETNLPIKHPVKRRLASREEVRNYILKHMEEDQDAHRLQRAAASLKKFGLVPRDFDLRKFMLDVLEDQVAGYYDPKTKTVNLLDWVAPEAQRPVLAHELTHALQDQSFDLQKWLMVSPEADKKPDSNLDNTTYDPEEAQAAREAVSEGQAMAVLVDFMLQPSGKSLADVPMMVELYKQSTIERSEDSPVLGSAPMYLRESLIFPYTDGLDFVQTLLTAGGKDRAFPGALMDPPRDTREVMQPKTYLANRHVAPLYLPKMGAVLKGKYEKYDLGEVGQFDVYILLKQFTTADQAQELAPAWRGGTYMLLSRLPVRRGNGAAVEPHLSELALVYLSRWATPEDASLFAAAYSSWIPKKYKSAKPGGNSNGDSAASAKGGWLTEEGPVYVEARDNRVVVLESFDDDTATKLRNILLADTRASGRVTPAASLAARLRDFLRY
jgi:hypothetical protein